METQFKKIGSVIIEHLSLNDFDLAIFCSKHENGEELDKKFRINDGSYYLAPDDTIQKYEHLQHGYYYGRRNGELVSYIETRVHKIVATSDGHKYQGIPVLFIDDLLRCSSDVNLEKEVDTEKAVSSV